MMFTDELTKALEAIWPMCRKNELYTEEMFIQDLMPKIKQLISKHLGEEEEITKLGHFTAIGSNNRLNQIKKALEL